MHLQQIQTHCLVLFVLLTLFVGKGYSHNKTLRVTFSKTDNCPPQLLLPYMQCSNIQLDRCEQGLTQGSCKNVKGEQCALLVTQDGYDGQNPVQAGSVRCRNGAGCGFIVCPEWAYTNKLFTKVDCMGEWGFCELHYKAYIDPEQCLNGHMDTSNVDCRCDETCKNSRFYALTIGIPISTVTLTSIVFACLALLFRHYYKHKTYQSLQGGTFVLPPHM